MSLIFQRSLPTPLSSQKCPPTPQINTQFGFFHSYPHPNESPSPPLLQDPPNSSSPLLMDSCLDQLNWLSKLDARMKEFIGRIYLDKMQQRQYGLQNESESSASPRKYTEGYSNRHQAAAVHHTQDPGLARHGQNSSSSSSLSSSSCFPVLSLDTEMTNPSLSVWDVHRHNRST